MNARRFAHKLAINGISSTRSSEGTEEVDGSIDITPKISIQIPTYGNRVGVVRESEDGETYLFYPSRPSSDLAGIVADVKKSHRRLRRRSTHDEKGKPAMLSQLGFNFGPAVNGRPPPDIGSLWTFFGNLMVVAKVEDTHTVLYQAKPPRRVSNRAGFIGSIQIPHARFYDDLTEYAPQSRQDAPQTAQPPEHPASAADAASTALRAIATPCGHPQPETIAGWGCPPAQTRSQ